MINYDSAHIFTLLKWRGSVFPKATKYALIVSLAAGLLKEAEDRNWYGLHNTAYISNSAAVGGFQFVLSFVIVFRASQCYTRFCQCASSVCELRSQLAEAASSLVTFTVMSKKSAEETNRFKHLIIRLFSILHATALEVIAEEQHAPLPVIDSKGVEATIMKSLEAKSGKDKVDTVYQWINILIVQSLADGLLNIPPPILSRVFQELEKGMVSYNQVMQIMAIPFPFPYAQATMVLIVFYMLLIPFIMVSWANNSFFAFVCTYVSTVSVLSIELTATELENPFGDDPNDLPCSKFQEDMNASLLILLDPAACVVPTLNSKAILNYEKLSAAPYDMFYEDEHQEVMHVKVATCTDEPKKLENCAEKGGDQNSGLPAELQMAQEPPPRMPQASFAVSQASRSLESRRHEEDKAFPHSSQKDPEVPQPGPGPVKSIDPQLKMETNNTAFAAGLTRDSTMKSEGTWQEKLAHDQQTMNQEMLQTLVGILKRLDQPLCFSTPCATTGQGLLQGK